MAGSGSSELSAFDGDARRRRARRRGQQVEHVLRERQPPEPQAVQHVLQTACESVLTRLAPKRPRRPFSVCTARNGLVHEPGVFLPGASAVFRASRLRRLSTSSCASEKNSISCLVDPLSHLRVRTCRPFSSCAFTRVRRSSGVKRFATYRRHRARGRGSDHAPTTGSRCRMESRDELRCADELDSARARDVGHVDVGDDEIVRAARQKAVAPRTRRTPRRRPRRPGPHAGFERRAGRRNHAERVLDHENLRHGGLLGSPGDGSAE